MSAIDYTETLAVAVERLTIAIDRLIAHEERDEPPARLPYRVGALSNAPLPAFNRAVKLVWVHAGNELNAVGDTYLQLYDEIGADSISVGDTVPKLTLLVSAGGGLDDNLGDGIKFSRGIVVAATANRDGSGGAPAFTLLVNLAVVPA